ncbi:MAG: hypothetical protein AB1430_08085 [Pseudomonadota bacterium]
MSLEADRIRRRTAREVLRRIDNATVAELSRCAEAGPAATSERLRRLDREWDADRVLEAEAATMGLLGLALGKALGPRWAALSGVAAVAVLVQALTGRYPLMPLFRRLGVRTGREIERERYALKALRGDFAGLGAQPQGASQPVQESAAQELH